MSLDEIPDLRCLVMLGGDVFGNLDAAAPNQPMEMRLGDARVSFSPCDTGPLAQDMGRETHRLDPTGITMRSYSDPYEDAPGDVYACWINHLTDWSLSDGETLQVMINRYDAPCRIFFKNRIAVPRVTQGMWFECLMAVHRAEAILHLVFVDPSNGHQERHSIPFDSAFSGGTLRSGHAHVTHPIPQRFRSCDVTFEVEYIKHHPNDQGVEPFVFLSDMQVVGASEGPQQQSLLEPELLYGNPPSEQGRWVKAPLPHVIRPDQDMALQVGPQTYPVSPVDRPVFTVRENYGHTLVCTASQDMDLVLCIDGTNTEITPVRAGDNIIRIPNRFLNGHVRHLSLKDRSGSLVYFEHQQLMPYSVTPEDVMRRESAAPFPATLFAQTPHRYAALKAWLAKADKTTDFGQLTHALDTLEGGHENATLKPLAFHKVAAPDVSIVIPAHNKVEVTYLALCSLLLARNDCTFEVILVDDASTDETRDLEKLVSGITVLHNASPQRFVRACNAGAQEARGKYIALLNNDVEVTAGWLDALLLAFARFDNVGLVGSKLLYPNGQLQDAGGIVWNSGNPWNYGNGENPNEPRFSYARQADYLSGAALMLPSALWHQLGGLSTMMEPMYFEDTDLAFKVREAGYTTWFIPSSVVYHFEGMTSGTDVTTGFKKYQEVNRPKFKRRWASAFARNGTEGDAPDLEKDRGIIGRVLFVDYAPPRADKDAGSYAAVQEMQLVQSLGYKVTFLSTNMAHLGKYTEDLQQMGVEVIYAPFYMNTAEFLEKHAREFDAFYITRYYVAQAVLDHIRLHAPQAKVLFNNADLHFLRELRTARSEADAGIRDRACQTRDAELDVIRAVDVVLSYNDVEHSVIDAYTDGTATVVKCPWVVQVPETVPGIADRRGLSFLGSYKHHPNSEGIIWFARSVMPLLGTGDAACPLAIYGSGMTDEIRGLSSDRVFTHGFVQEVSDAFHPHRIFVAPLLSGAGIKGKVITALAHGIPAVVSPIAAEGIGLRSGHDCFIATTPQEWTDAINLLNTDDALWTAMSENARRYMRDQFSFSRGRAAMRRVFEAADMYGSLQ